MAIEHEEYGGGASKARRTRVELSEIGNNLPDTPEGAQLLNLIMTVADQASADTEGFPRYATAMFLLADGTTEKARVELEAVRSAAGLNPDVKLKGVHRDWKDIAQDAVSLVYYK